MRPCIHVSAARLVMQDLFWLLFKNFKPNFSVDAALHAALYTWVKDFRINPEFRILRLTFYRKSAQNAELGDYNSFSD